MPRQRVNIGGLFVAAVQDTDGLWSLSYVLSDDNIAALAAAFASPSGNQSSSDESTLLASAARTTTTNSADQIKPIGIVGSVFILNVTVAGGALKTLRMDLQIKDPISGNYVSIGSTGIIGATVTPVGAYALVCGLGVANPLPSVLIGQFPAAVSLPRTYRVQIVPSDSTSWTYSVAQSLLR